MTTAIEKVFIGDSEILCIRGQDGHGYVVVRRVCEALGLAEQSQATKLKRARWAGTTMIVAPDGRGRNQELFCLRIEGVPMWLAGVNARKVAPEMRPRLEAFQLEASQALWDWFRGAEPKQLPDPRIDALERAVAGMVETNSLVLRSMATLASEVKTLRDHGDTISPQSVYLSFVWLLTITLKSNSCPPRRQAKRRTFNTSHSRPVSS